MCIGSSRVGRVEVATGIGDPKTITCSRFGPHRLEARHERHHHECPSARPRHPARALRSRLALPGPGRRRSATASRTAIEAFGGKLVVWADTQGEINVLDGYCRHMGGDLTQGEVKGDEIACPFHDWRWGGDGKCKAIPYARRVPLRARTQKYETAIATTSC